MKTIIGNILSTNRGIICHQVNAQRIAGAGLALKIREQFPKWYEYYLRTYPIVGSTSLYMANNKLTIASLYAQDSYGREKCHTDYRYMSSCLKALLFVHGQIYIPYGMGCGLAGGDWSRVSRLIQDILPMAVIVKLQGDL